MNLEVETFWGDAMKCPGQDMRNLRVEVYKCPNCGAEVEIFSDELKVRCHRCRKLVYKEKLPSCIDWCASARQCLGEARWRELRGDGDKEARNDD